MCRQPMGVSEEQLCTAGACAQPADGIESRLNQISAWLCERVRVQQLCQRLQQRRRPCIGAGMAVGDSARRLLRERGQERCRDLLAPRSPFLLSGCVPVWVESQ